MKKFSFFILAVLIVLSTLPFHYPGKVFSQKRKGKTNKKNNEKVIENRHVVIVGTLSDFKLLQTDNKKDMGKYSISIAQNSLGNIYLVRSSPPRILVFNNAGQFIFSFGEQGDEEGKIRRPFGIAIDGQDMVYICDARRAKVVVFTPLGDFLEEFSSNSALSKDDEYQSKPGCIAVNKQKNELYISDGSNGHIWIYDLQGNFSRYFRGADSGICNPGTVRFDKQNRVYVAECAWDRSRVFEEDGTELLRIGKGSGRLAGQFSRLDGIAVDSKGRIYAADILLRCIQVFDPKGKLIGVIKWLNKAENKVYFERIIDIYIGQDDLIFVVDQGADKVYLIKDNS